MSEGWVKMHRKIFQWEWYKHPTVSRVFMHLVMKANHAPARWQGIEIKPGQMVTSYRHLADELGLSVATIQRSVKKLISTGEITAQPNAKFTIITVLRYYQYQDSDTLMKHSCNTQETLTISNNNKKNENNKKNISSPAAHEDSSVNAQGGWKTRRDF